MKESLIVDPNYSDRSLRFRDVIHRFDEVGEVLMDGERNILKKVQIADSFFVVKKFRTPFMIQGLVYQFLRKSKAKRSYQYAKKLLELDIKTPSPVAYAERTSFGLKDSYYISEFVDYDFDFRVLNHNPLWPDRNNILKQFATFTFEMHEKGVQFLDHSPGNTLIISHGNGEYDFYLIDLNRMQFRDLDFESRMYNFRRLWLSKTMINVMAPVYAELYGKSSEETHRLMTKYSRQFQKKVNSKKLRKRRNSS